MGRATALATLVAGTLDIAFAMILTLLFGREIGAMLRYVGSGPFPPAAELGALGSLIGLLTHFALMAIMAAIYIYLARRRRALLDHARATAELARRTIPAPADRRRLERLATRLRRRLAHPGGPGVTPAAGTTLSATAAHPETV